jgi:hypothetical protein
MTSEIQKHLWADLIGAPSAPGVYAWYYSPQITDYDLDAAIGDIQAKRDEDRASAERVAKTLLDERIFKQFREEPYRAVVEGPLKPSYSGALEHDFEVSPSLVSRLVDDPERLRSLRDILDRSAPIFASPLYIGMSVNLRTRLGKHKSLIEKYRVARLNETPPQRNSDAGFAWQIAKRQVPPDRLFVFTCVIGSDDENTAIDIENVLNRLYYPILGRN